MDQLRNDLLDIFNNYLKDQIEKDTLNCFLGFMADEVINKFIAHDMTKEYIDFIQSLQKNLSNQNEKYREENRMLNKDINLLLMENEKLKTKIKMNKILMEHE